MFKIQDGFVSFKEFALGLLLISGNEENDEAFNFVFNLFDTNGSGNIDIKEAEEVSGREKIDIKPGTNGFCGPRHFTFTNLPFTPGLVVV